MSSSGKSDTKENSDGSSDFEGFENSKKTDTMKESDENNAAASAHLTSLTRQRNQVLRKVVRIQNAVENVEVQFSLSQLKVSVKNLQAAYSEFSGFHSQIIAMVSAEEEDHQEDVYVDFEETYNWTYAAIESMIQDFEKPADPIAPTPQVIIHQQPLKAPIPTFDGEYTKWPKFKAMFQDVMAQSRDSDAIKLYHLDKALVGAAAGVLDAKTMNDGNYTQAWNILKERYENQRVIVETHIRGLLSLKKMTAESNKELRSLLDECTNHVESLEYLEQPMTGVSEVMVVYLLTSSLDKSTRKHWEQTLTPGELPAYKPTVTFLKSQCQVLERCESACPTSKPTSSVPKYPLTKLASQRTHAAAASTHDESNEKCDFCGGSHRNYQCNKLNTLSSSEKNEKVRSAGVCFNCLRKGHRSKDCPSSGTCRKCQRRHHTQLHDDDYKPNPRQETLAKAQPTTQVPEQPKENSVSTSCSCNYTQAPKTVFLLTAVVQVVDKNNVPQECRVLLDSGSQVNFVSEKMADILGTEKKRVNIPIAGINNLRTIARDKMNVRFHSRCSEYRAELECLVTPKVTGTIPSRDIDVSGWIIPDGIQLADPAFFNAGRIDMLIGAELFFKLLKPSHITNDDGLPELRDSHLGWLVSGAIEAGKSDPIQFSQVASIESVEDSIAKFWQIEEVPDADPMSSEEQRCEEHFASTHIRDSTGRFTVRLPLKESAEQIDSCRTLALKRFFMLENRLKRNPDLKSQYVDFIREYQHLGHCREVHEATDDAKWKPYYMPHHAVLRPGSSSTKCRVVFDASAKSAPRNLSLNDVLLVGPVIQSDLYAIMLRFRKHRYVFTADIAKMYRQIRVHSDDAHYQRIFWRENPTEPVKVLELTTVTYGTASAPFQATRSLLQLAIDEAEEFPIAAKIVKKDTYVDDVLTGCNTLHEAIEAQHQLKAMMEKGGFPIHKWCSNSLELLKNVPKEEQEEMKPNENDPFISVIKVLGLLWVPTSDELLLAHCASSVSDSNLPPTKRRIYSEVAKLFDPLGLFSPTLVLAKLLVQQLWQSKYGWDDTIDDDTITKWNELRQSLPQLHEITLPRQVTFNAILYELHGFADASNVAYGACIYIRSIFLDGTATSRLLTSKSKVAPLHELSIPRKELCAALLLSRLVTKVISCLEMSFVQVMLWSDSQIVLAWLKKHPDQLELFVRNRVVEIKSKTEECQWNYVRTHQNPADVVSRGQLPAALKNNCLWWEGPKFLAAPIIKVEEGDEIPDHDLPELKPTVMATPALITEALPLFTKYSCFRKLQRVIAWILRFKHNALKHKSERITESFLNVSEHRQSMVVIVRVIQHLELSDEIERVKRNIPCKCIGALNPSYNNTLLRVGGRLKHSNLPEETKHQFILPNTSSVTKLFIRAMHREHLHLGPSGLIAAIRQRYWLLNARSTVRQVTGKCVKCFRTKPSDVSQLMGEYPKQRVQPSPPFSITGVDYAGPISVKQGMYRPKICKGYIAVFVCMATKAVHLELVSDLSTEAFISALQRFISRRGMVAEIHSDNATCFHGAKNELHKLYKLFQQEAEVNRIRQFCQAKEMEWHFIPPDAPEFGGLWEAAVKSTKTHLKRVVGNVTLTFEEMATILCEIEAVLNSRPLFAISNDPADPEVISPAHFLIGRPLTAMPEPAYDEVKVSRLNRWQHLQLLRQHFWRAWSRDYLLSLQPRKKNWNTLGNVKPGTIILLHDKNRPPLLWKLGRVTAVHPGSDGLVRAVDVFSEGNTYRRPITKLSILPIEVPVPATQH